ncbi:hypothetical protein IFM89_012419 [Coptis chinensis]|uniref:Selenoprotein H n=1 Tax=Coptis chinensis TaxID=261450 RepID=A0A835M7T8_9MAGN|nr:hypothetical protein IFM89_012419 [Coptis chinensis]
MAPKRKSPKTRTSQQEEPEAKKMTTESNRRSSPRTATKNAVAATNARLEAVKEVREKKKAEKKIGDGKSEEVKKAGRKKEVKEESEEDEEEDEVKEVKKAGRKKKKEGKKKGKKKEDEEDEKEKEGEEDEGKEGDENDEEAEAEKEGEAKDVDDVKDDEEKKEDVPEGADVMDDDEDGESGDDNTCTIASSAEFASADAKKIIIEHCKSCQSFKVRATRVKDGLENTFPGIKVLLNPEKPRRGCFEVREEGAEPLFSLLDLKRPFTPMKDLDMEEVISNIVKKLNETPTHCWAKLALPDSVGKWRFLTCCTLVAHCKGVRMV